MSELQTGDLFLFGNPHTLLSRFIQWGDGSNVSHVGVVLVDPPFLSERGIYLLESGSEPFPDVEIHEEQYGVRISKLEDVIRAYQAAEGNVWLRQCAFDLDPTDEELKHIHLEVHNRGYDDTTSTWVKDFWGWFGVRTDKHFTCSGLAAFVLSKLGVLDNDIDWTHVTPTMLIDNDHLRWRRPYKEIEVYLPLLLHEE
jgi:hypothetical protein